MTQVEAEAPEASVAAEPETFPYARQCPFAPPEQYNEYIGQTPIKKVTLTTGREAWAVFGYQEIRELLTDPRISSSRKHDGFPFYFHAPSEFRTETSFIGFDPPEHTKVRRKAAVTFTNRQVQRLRAAVERATDERIDAMLAAGPPVDLHEMLSLAVPMTMICELLGVPYSDHPFLQEHGARLLGGTSTPAERAAAMVEVGDYLEKLVQSKEREPGEDLISKALAEWRASGEEWTMREMVNMCRLLLNGGHESTGNHITLGTAALLEHPEQLEALRNDPALIYPAIEELVRWLGVGDLAVPRVALADIELGGELIRKGDGILCLVGAANRDPRAFENPDELILERGTRRHIGFGHGVHHCIGADLARLELEVVLTKLFKRIPTLRLAVPLDEVPTKERAVIYGFEELYVTW
jgi:cytochrome P450